MKKFNKTPLVLSLLIALLVSGCDLRIQPESFEFAEKLCLENDGLKSVTVRAWKPAGVNNVHCKDGASFESVDSRSGK